jgi:glutamate synthase domain-containing protein 3
VQDAALLKNLIARHLDLTGSRRAKWILENWSETLPRFLKVFPHEFKRVLGVSRSRSPRTPSQPVAPVAHVQQSPLAQVQNG